MRAARFHGPQDGIVVEDIERPSPGPGEVLVEVEACGICHSDLHFMNGDLPIPTPMTLGHEAAGTVAEVGAGVAGIDTGTSVVVHGGWGCGHCADCTRGETQLCNIMEWQGIGQDGAYAEYVVVPDERYVLPIGDLSPVEAAPLTDAALTPYRAIGRARKHLTPADTVTIVGIGGLGQYAVQFAAMTGAQVVAVDLNDRKLDLAAELGADVTVDATAKRVPAAIREATGGEGTDAIVDFVASEETTDWAANALATRGRVYIVGIGSGSFDVSFNPLVGSETTATACYWGSINGLREVLEIAQRGALDIGVETVGFGGLHDAFDRLQAGEIARRAVLTPEA